MNYYLITDESTYLLEIYFPVEYDDIINIFKTEGITLSLNFNFNKISKNETTNISCRKITYC